MDRVDGEQTGQAASIKKQVAAASFIGIPLNGMPFSSMGPLPPWFSVSCSSYTLTSSLGLYPLSPRSR